MKVAYADPPYRGKAKKHYGCEEVDQHALIRMLVDEFPDGWALSCNSVDLAYLLPVCPPKTRVSAWCKPHAIYKKFVPVTYAWEPVLWIGGRGWEGDFRIVDHLLCGRHKVKGFVGAKPPEFSQWIFNMLGLQKGDELVDLFPGSGAVTAAWEEFSA